jgi:hypothetical protein
MQDDHCSPLGIGYTRAVDPITLQVKRPPFCFTWWEDGVVMNHQ